MHNNQNLNVNIRQILNKTGQQTIVNIVQKSSNTKNLKYKLNNENSYN